MQITYIYVYVFITAQYYILCLLHIVIGVLTPHFSILLLCQSLWFVALPQRYLPTLSSGVSLHGLFLRDIYPPSPVEYWYTELLFQ